MNTFFFIICLFTRKLLIRKVWKNHVFTKYLTNLFFHWYAMTWYLIWYNTELISTVIFHWTLRKHQISKSKWSFSFLLLLNTVFHSFSCMQVGIWESWQRSALHPCTGDSSIAWNFISQHSLSTNYVLQCWIRPVLLALCEVSCPDGTNACSSCISR